MKCSSYSEHNVEICEVCNKPLDPKEAVIEEKMQEVAAVAATELCEINPKRFEEIALSLGVELRK